jgi:hypothetical protein
MLTVNVKPKYVATSTGIKWIPNTITDADELFQDIREDTYFYVDGGTVDKPN